jgi:hypothetical protein
MHVIHRWLFYPDFEAFGSVVLDLSVLASLWLSLPDLLVLLDISSILENSSSDFLTTCFALSYAFGLS